MARNVLMVVATVFLGLAGCATPGVLGQGETGPCLVVAQARGMVEPGGDAITVMFWVQPGYQWEWGEVDTLTRPVSVQLPPGFVPGMREGGTFHTRLLFYRSDAVPISAHHFAVTVRLPGWRFTEGRASLILYQGKQWTGCPSNKVPLVLTQPLITWRVAPRAS